MVCTLFGVAILALLIGSHKAPDEALESRPLEIAADGYLGSQACRECHPHQHATWHGSYHRTMTQIPTADSVVGDFAGVSLERFGGHFRLGREKDRFWVELDSQALG